MFISTLGALDATQIVLIVLIGVLLIAFPIMTMTRNKREKQKMIEMTNSLKRGDKIMMTSGIYGTIVDLKMEGETTMVTIETGSGKNKGYLTFNAAAIYSIMNDEEPKKEPQPANVEGQKVEAPKPGAKTQEVKEVKAVQPKAEIKDEKVKNEKKAS